MSKHKKGPVLIGKTLSWIAFRIYIFLFLIVRAIISETLPIVSADFLGELIILFIKHIVEKLLKKMCVL